MRYFPINLDIQNKRCLVVGGGTVACRKVKALLQAGAKVLLVSPHINESMKGLVEDGHIDWRKKRYETTDIGGAVLIFAATDDSGLGEKIFQDAKAMNIPVNVADMNELCTFTLPSRIERGDLLITISSGGKCPAFSKHMRLKLEEIVDDDYGEMLDILAEVREKLHSAGITHDKCRDLLNKLIDSDILSCLKNDDRKGAAIIAGEELREALSINESINNKKDQK